MVKHDNQWGTVCDDYISSADCTCRYSPTRSTLAAQSACRTLGLSGGSIETLKYNGSEPTWLDDIDCASNTTNFLSCSNAGWGEENCSHSEDVLLTCT